MKRKEANERNQLQADRQAQNYQFQEPDQANLTETKMLSSFRLAPSTIPVKENYKKLPSFAGISYEQASLATICSLQAERASKVYLKTRCKLEDFISENECYFF
jgi:hypothetical protein